MEGALGTAASIARIHTSAGRGALGLCLILGLSQPCAAALKMPKIGDRWPVLAISAVAAGEMDPAVRQMLETEVPEAAARFANAFRRVEVEIFHQYAEAQPKGPPRRFERIYLYSIADDPRLRLVVRKDVNSVSATNDRYMFQARGAQNTQGTEGLAAFQLDDCRPWQPYTESLLPGPLLLSGAYLNSVASMRWWPLKDVVSNRNFQPIVAEIKQSAEGRRARYVFRYQGVAHRLPYAIPDSVFWLELLPDRSWAVARSGSWEPRPVTGKGGPWVVDIQLEYGSTFGGAPFPKERLEVYADYATKKITHIEYEQFGEPRVSDHPRDVYFLPHYGISEKSVEVLTPNRSWRLVILIAGAACFVIFGLLFLLSTRWRPQAH